MANFLYVDNSNLWIEGMRVAAVQRGQVKGTSGAAHQKAHDYSWKVNFGRLLGFAGGARSEVKRALLVGSRSLQNELLWVAARASGFEVVVHNRNVSGKEKKVDPQIMVSMIEDSYERVVLGRDEMTLVAGDSDYVPALENLTKRGIPVHVVFWGQAALELKEAATKFINLDPYLEHLANQPARLGRCA